MKKLFFSIFTASILLTSCNKADIQQASDTIKNADSLFQEAKKSYNTLDSISRMVKDSNNTIGKVVVPEIEKHREIIEDAVKKGNISIDSVKKEFDKIKEKAQRNEDIAKAIDSATSELKSGNINAKDLLESANKILKKVKENPEQSSQKVLPKDSKISSQSTEIEPVIKTARLNIAVENITDAKAILRQELKNTNGDLITENYSENEGIAREFITAKVPLSGFNNLVNNLGNLGAIQTKVTESTGKDYVPNQMCDVEITFTDSSVSVSASSAPSDDLNIVNSEKNKEGTFGAKSENAFMKGFNILGSIFLALLPFWPIFLIVAIVYYFYRKRKLKEKTAAKINTPQSSNQRIDKTENIEQKKEENIN